MTIFSVMEPSLFIRKQFWNGLRKGLPTFVLCPSIDMFVLAVFPVIVYLVSISVVGNPLISVFMALGGKTLLDPVLLHRPLSIPSGAHKTTQMPFNFCY